MNGVIHTRALKGTRLAILIAAGLVALCLPFSGAFGQRPHDSHSAPAPHNSQPQNSAPHNSAPRPQPQPQYSRPQGGGPQNQPRPGQQYPPYRPQSGQPYQRPSASPFRNNPGAQRPPMNPQPGARGNYLNAPAPYPGQGYPRPGQDYPHLGNSNNTRPVYGQPGYGQTGNWPATFFAATPVAAGICSSRPPGRMA